MGHDDTALCVSLLQLLLLRMVASIWRELAHARVPTYSHGFSGAQRRLFSTSSNNSRTSCPVCLKWQTRKSLEMRKETCLSGRWRLAWCLLWWFWPLWCSSGQLWFAVGDHSWCLSNKTLLVKSLQPNSCSNATMLQASTGHSMWWWWWRWRWRWTGTSYFMRFPTDFSK